MNTLPTPVNRLNVKYNMKIETDRLLLREHSIEDYGRFWEMITDPIARRFTGGTTLLTYEQRLKLFCEDCIKPHSIESIEFAVIEKSSMLYIGYCGCRYSEELKGHELFYGYSRDSWGKGYGFEAAYAIVNLLFDKVGINCLLATCEKKNVASIRILNRLGFEYSKQLNINGLELFKLRKEALK